MTTIILGANGKLGAILAAYARKTGLEWRTQTRSGDADIIWSGDVDDPAADDVFVRGATIINMIGSTGNDADILHDINVRFVQCVLAKAAQTGVAHVVLVSSAAVYGAGHDEPLIEDDAFHPLTPYGISKVAMEQVARTAPDDGLEITVMRIGNVAGADALTAAAQRHIAAGTSMSLHRFKDGSAPTRSYIGPHDLFRAVRDLTNTPAAMRTVNVVHPQPVTLDAVLTAYRAHVMPKLEWTDTPAPDGTPQNVTLSTVRLRRTVNFPEYSDPADMLGRQVAEYLAL